jgi:phospholipase/lecithinase/hemolysin
MTMHGRSRITRHLAWIVVLALTMLGTSLQAGDITGIVAFGDSLSDVGNTYLAFGYPSSPPYYQGHYSNGPIWLEYLAGRLGVAAPTPSQAAGTGYAWGFAQTGPGYTTTPLPSSPMVPNIGTQISTFLASNTLSSTQLITIWGGANDFLNGGQSNPAVPVGNLATEITSLAAAGGKLFMVPNLPLLGDIPATSTMPQPVRDGLNALSLGYDMLLHNELNTLQQSLAITIYQPGIEALFENVIASPAAYGFANVTDALLYSSDPPAPGSLFWDTVHPTTAAGQIIGEVAFASMVPEPSSMTLVLIAAPLALLAWRWRAASHITRSSAQG